MKQLFGWIKGWWHSISEIDFHPTVMYWNYVPETKTRIACHTCDKTFWKKEG